MMMMMYYYYYHHHRHQHSITRLRNDLYCVGWGVKLYSLTHSAQHHMHIAPFAELQRCCVHACVFSALFVFCFLLRLL